MRDQIASVSELKLRRDEGKGGGVVRGEGRKKGVNCPLLSLFPRGHKHSVPLEPCPSVPTTNHNPTPEGVRFEPLDPIIYYVCVCVWYGPVQ